MYPRCKNFAGVLLLRHKGVPSLFAPSSQFSLQGLRRFPSKHNLCEPNLSSYNCVLRRNIRITNSMPSEEVTLQFAKLTHHATTPTRGSALAAGYDLYSAYDCSIPARGKEIVKTDIQIALPDGCYGRVAPRSGLAAKHFIDVGAGVIDQDYRGNVGVVMFNFSDNEFAVKKGDRIAQLICERIYMPELKELPTLNETDRGSGGFGSTGKN